jgi:hypothetical protein
MSHVLSVFTAIEFVNISASNFSLLNSHSTNVITKIPFSFGKTCRPTQTHYPDSEPSSLWSLSLMLHA